MRLSSMLFGGLIGAAATLYISRKKPGAAMRASRAVSGALSSMSGKAMSKMINMDWKHGANEAMSHVPKPTDDTAETSAGAWEQIEALIENDPEVKAEVDQIKAESSSNMTH
ncbi:hypothetical protein [Paenibacillus sp. HB172176]|uniref:hypothetical protein n=1 Tax=Paenibacillus sp. HB172176 TaxID=2493690 RepID=UPI00143AE858|nr:hypothetical protein [Paenibacillus sp. HB172176]